MPGGASGDTTAAAADKMDVSMTAVTKSFPAKAQGLGGQLLQPAVQPDGTRQYELTAKVTPWEVSPGHVVQAWTYNGTVPGPTIHVNIGDKVRVILHNQLPESTVIHFHGLIVPNAMDGVPDITQPSVKSGKDFSYEFTAKGPAVGMYHSHYDAAKQVTNGLAGALWGFNSPIGPPRHSRITSWPVESPTAAPQESVGPLLGERPRAGEGDRHLRVAHREPAEHVRQPGTTARRYPEEVRVVTLGHDRGPP